MLKLHLESHDKSIISNKKNGMVIYLKKKMNKQLMWLSCHDNAIPQGVGKHTLSNSHKTGLLI